MATISNTSRPGYVWDTTDNVWYPIGTGVHTHDYVASTLIDAKGDLIVGSAADTAARLAVGTNNYVLTADSAATNGVKWAALPSGFTSQANYVTTDQGTSSTSFTDLSTTQSVTLTTGTKALILLSAIMYKNNAASCWISFGVTGATTLAAADARSIINYTNESDVSKGISGSFYLDNLTAGSNTFTMKFKVNSGTGNWYNRNIAVIDMGS